MDSGLITTKTMKNTKKSPRKFRGMGYRQVQGANSRNRQKLSKSEQQWLKKNSYKNVGWENVISLYKQIEEFNGETLESLFLAADKIGNKYQTREEIQTYQEKLAQTVTSISKKIEQQYPETEVEVIDYSENCTPKYRRKGSSKSYRTLKV